MSSSPLPGRFPGDFPFEDGQRASDADRDVVAERLREAAAEGRIDFEELDERLEAALSARTYGQLRPLLADLPAAPGPVPPPAPPAGEPLELRGGTHGVRRAGEWAVPAHLVVHGGLGGVALDFTRVRTSLAEILVEVYGEMAGVRIVVPESWRVETDGVAPGLGGVRDRTTPRPERGAPLLRLTGAAGIGGVRVKNPGRLERARLRMNPPRT
ncbi:DUF1707 SHOCT-like domain-containing protein [Streptomyces sp. NRRL F-5630]|uniref:DUF1707 SHOCT-like domain-containing protein n=1 Tax=Streptomyces sp. NRRL F-5630 TaxID=1463864 RepID=UPI003D71867B